MAAEKKYQDSGSYAQKSDKIDISIINSLLNKISDKRDKLIIKLFVETSCNSNEIVNLKYQDINFENNSLTIKAENTRNKESRTISISEKLSLELKQFCNKKNNYVFSTKKSPRLRTRSVRKIFDKYSKLFGIKITSDSIRKASLIELINNKPIDEIKKVSGIKKIEIKEYLSKEEVYKIRNEIKNKRDQLIFNILYETGCKLNEIINIKINNIEFTTKAIKFKNKKQRSTPISEKLSLQIKEYAKNKKLSDNNNLFSTRQSNNISDKRIFQIIKKYSNKAGFKKVNPQILRNTHIANNFSEGKSIVNISKNTGIQNLNKIGIYGNLMTKKND